MTPQICQKEQFFDPNLNFRGHIWTFGAQNTPKNWPFEAKNKAQTLPKQLQNNFEKVQKSTFLTPKKGDIMLKLCSFLTHFSALL